MPPRWMIYGANGYTGEMTAEEAVRRGHKPILAGRREDAVRALAERLGCEHAVFALDEPAAIARHLEGISALLLCAGPFSTTSAPTVEACLRARTSYLDITGEIPVFEACFARDAEARERGITILPGVGFDVVPSDCLAAVLAETLPGAAELELAFGGLDTPSGGTLKTTIEGLARGGMVRRGGELVRVPLAWKQRNIPFRDKPRQAVSIPWGDVATAWHSTGIPDIVVYMAMSRGRARSLRMARAFRPLLGLGFMQRWIKGRIRPGGPDAEARARQRGQLWGRVRHLDGRTAEATLEVPNGYDLTVLTSLEAVLRVAAGKVSMGALTPSRAFGSRFITEIAGCDLRVAG